MEIWKPVKDFANYEVSNLGNVKSLSRKVWNGRGFFYSKELILKKSIDTKGYSFIRLCKDGMPKSRTIHQLVAEAFLNHIPCKHKLVVNHKDFNKQNNCIDNLEVVTNRQNKNQKT